MSDTDKIRSMKKELQQTREKLARVEGQFESAKEKLEATQAKAKDEFGTDDPSELQKMAEEHRNKARDLMEKAEKLIEETRDA